MNNFLDYLYKRKLSLVWNQERYLYCVKDDKGELSAGKNPEEAVKRFLSKEESRYSLDF